MGGPSSTYSAVTPQSRTAIRIRCSTSWFATAISSTLTTSTFTKTKASRALAVYGDIMIRDRKMYVAPTPFGLTTGTAHNQTLILPAGFSTDSRFLAVGNLLRREADKLIVGYAFDLRTNTLKPESMNNPAAGKEHKFVA